MARLGRFLAGVILPPSHVHGSQAAAPNTAAATGCHVTHVHPPREVWCAHHAFMSVVRGAVSTSTPPHSRSTIDAWKGTGVCGVLASTVRTETEAGDEHQNTNESTSGGTTGRQQEVQPVAPPQSGGSAASRTLLCLVHLSAGGVTLEVSPGCVASHGRAALVVLP